MSIVRVAALMLGFFSAVLAHATAQRTFVSTAGVDNPACSLVAPCRAFAAAITATSAGGEVIVLDSGGYGTVIISKSVSIVAPDGVYAGISVFSGAGVTIAAGVNDSIILRGLAITSQGGAYGIVLAAGAQLVIDRCVIVGAFTGAGIDINGPNDADILVRDTQISGSDTALNAIGGIFPGKIRLTVETTLLRDVVHGIHIFKVADVVVENSQLLGRTTGGSVTAGSYGVQTDNVNLQSVKLHIANSLIRDFAIGADITETGPSAAASITQSDFAYNGTAVRANNGGIVGLSGNRFAHNVKLLTKDPTLGYVLTSGTNYNFDGGLGDAPTGTGGLY